MSPKFEPSTGISVVFCVYNTAKYIEQALNSILQQTFTNIELIAIDNASEDNSLEILRRYAAQDERIRIIAHEKNLGLAASRNDGMNATRGKYVLLADSDDVCWPQDMFQYLYNVAEQFDADVVHSPGFYVFTDATETRIAPTQHEVPNPYPAEPAPLTNDMAERMRLWSERKIFWNLWNKLFKRQLFVDYNIVFDDFDDMPVCFRALYYAKNYIRIPQPIYIYRNNPTSIGHVWAKDNPRKQLTRQIHTVAKMNEYMKQMPFFAEHPESRQTFLDLLVRRYTIRHIVQGRWPYKLIEGYDKDELETILAENYGENAAAFTASLIRLLQNYHVRSQQLTYFFE